jgi:hypothetical protein
VRVVNTAGFWNYLSLRVATLRFRELFA